MGAALPLEGRRVRRAPLRPGPEAWPDPPTRARALRHSPAAAPLLRDQKVLAGIGRTWVDDILRAAKLSPFKRGDDLSDEEATALHAAIVGEMSTARSTYYAEHWKLPLPDKQAKVAHIHAHQGEPCPRCETVLEAVFFEDYVMTYCPTARRAAASSRTAGCRAC